MSDKPKISQTAHGSWSPSTPNNFFAENRYGNPSGTPMDVVTFEDLRTAHQQKVRDKYARTNKQPDRITRNVRGLAELGRGQSSGETDASARKSNIIRAARAIGFATLASLALVGINNRLDNERENQPKPTQEQIDAHRRGMAGMSEATDQHKKTQEGSQRHQNTTDGDSYIYTIQPHDTAWGIAERIAPENVDIRDVVDSIYAQGTEGGNGFQPGTRVRIPEEFVDTGRPDHSISHKPTQEPQP